MRRTVGRLVPRALASSSITPASIFRVIEAAQPTLLIDEGDRLDEKNKPELVAIVNSSHCRADAIVIRTVGDDHEPAAFSTWAPIMIWAIGKLPSTWVDRSIVIPMRRRTKDEAVERMRLDHDQGFGKPKTTGGSWLPSPTSGWRNDPFRPRTAPLSFELPFSAYMSVL